MSNATPNTYIDFIEAVLASDLSANARLIAIVIGKHYNWTKREACWPSNATLSEMSGMSVSTLGRAKTELAKNGWLEVSRQWDNSNLYIPTVPAGFAPEAAKAEKKANRKPATKKAQKAPVAPEKVEKVSEVTEPVVEAQATSQGFEMTDEEAQAVLDLDPFEDEPVVEAPAKPAKKSKKVEAPVMKTMAERLSEAKDAKNADQATADRILAESDDPEKAREWFNNPTWNPMTTDLVQRASSAAFKVEKVLETVPAKSVADSFDEEW